MSAGNNFLAGFIGALLGSTFGIILIGALAVKSDSQETSKGTVEGGKVPDSLEKSKTLVTSETPED